MLAAGEGFCLDMLKAGVVVAGVHHLIDYVREPAAEIGNGWMFLRAGVILGKRDIFCLGHGVSSGFCAKNRKRIKRREERESNTNNDLLFPQEFPEII
jgi:hypothetical protein